jgi:hypothetical protein
MLPTVSTFLLGPHRLALLRTPSRFVLAAALSILVGSWLLALPADAGQIWTDGNGDGLPDDGAVMSAAPGEVVSFDIWIDSQGFQWTNFLAYAEWEAACFTYVSAEYLISGGVNFPVDDFTHPSGIGFGGIQYDRSGVEAISRVSVRLTAPVSCCVTPIIDVNNPYYVFSQLGQGPSYFLFSSNPGSCWDASDDTPQACCFANGTCAFLTATECLAGGGVPQGPSTTCASVSCPLVTGACCFVSGACSELTRDACESAGGSYRGDDVACADVNCPPPTGACCLPNGSCVVETAAACDALGGIYQGDGVKCAMADCPQPPTGACCLPNGSCLVRTAAQCDALGGIYRGDDVTCAMADCPQPPTGACCLPNGSCLVQTATECDALGGVYRGDGVTCAEANCPQPPTGACCLPDGSCLVRTAAQCVGLEGIYQGDGVTCAEADCPQPPTGACCLPNGSCLVRTPAQCAGSGGIYQGDDVTCAAVNCPQPTGACCLSDSVCQEMTQIDCSAMGGRYLGDGTHCTIFSCRSGAPDCVGFATRGSVAMMRERSEPARMPKVQGTQCLLTGNTNGTAANYRWYNVCSSYIWFYSGWGAGEGVGTLYGGAAQPRVTDEIKRTITYFRNVVQNYGQTVDVFLDRGNASGCILGNIASDLDLDPGLRWNCSEFRACGASYVIVRTQHDGGAAPSFATDGPLTAGCDPNSPARSFYYGCNGSVCVPWVGPDGDSDNFLNWLIVDDSYCDIIAVQPTSWGKIKGLFR